jgi:hypothetical protein
MRTTGAKKRAWRSFGARGGELLAEGVGDDAGQRGDGEEERGAEDFGIEYERFEESDEGRGGVGEEDAAEKSSGDAHPVSDWRR